MPGSSTARRGRARARPAGLALLLVTALGVTACSDDEPPRAGTSPSSEAEPGAPTDATPMVIPPPVARGLHATLTQRALALREADVRRFLSGVAGEPAFRSQQTMYFDNLRQLPVTELRYQLHPRSLVRVDDDYWVVVKTSMQLGDFDSVPVTTIDRWRFSPVGDAGRRFVVTSMSDPAWEEEHRLIAQPWETGPIEVRQVPGVLGVFDSGSIDQARTLMSQTQQGLGQVAGVVPYPWSGSVVLYALSDPTFLNSLDVPGGDPDQVDGVTVDVRTGRDAVLASSRIVLHPDTIEQPGVERARLVRHELTHVAVGEHDDHAPVWLAEGIAEYVSTRPLPPERRAVPEAAIETAVDRELTDLPSDEAFDDTDNEIDYALSWWAVEYLTRLFGPEGLWRMLDELDDTVADPDDMAVEHERRLRELAGLTSRMLARKAGQLIVTEYATPETPPSLSPGTPGETDATASSTPGPY